MRDEHNNLRGFSKLMHDTTSIRLAQQANDRLAAIVQCSNDAIISFMLDGRIVSWNPAAQAMFGYTQEQALAMNFMELCPPNARAEHEKILENLRKGNNVVQFETTCQSQDSRKFHASVSASLAHDITYEPLAAAIIQNITDRKQVNDVLNQAKSAAEEANQIKDEFLATLSHELRTPLAAILLWSKMLFQSKELLPQFQEGLHAIQSSAEAQKTLIDDLLDTSRITAGTLRLQLRNAHPIALIKNTIEAIAPAAKAKKIQITTDLSNDAQNMLADPNRLRQVIWNLLSNAVKFTSAGGKVHVILNISDNHVQIKVKDTGLGISSEFLPQMFAPFRQADATTSRRNGGLGLGLAISKQLVELHGGSIEVHSEGLGKGSEFIVSLPFVPVSQEKTRIFPANQTHLSLAGRSVLLVEDDNAMRQALIHILEQKKITVSAADSAKHALAILDQHTPDLIISDIGMPEMDGHALLKQIRQWESKTHTAEIPVIALTSYIKPEDRQAALDAGFKSYLTKPVEPDQLFNTLRELLK